MGHAAAQLIDTGFRSSGNVFGRVFDHLSTPFGERIQSDEMRHRLIVEHNGRRRYIGTEGGGEGEFEFPRGLAFLAGKSREESRLFVCDSWNHRIQVFNGDGDFLMAFGSLGPRLGQLQVPSGITVAWPHWEDGTAQDDEPLLVVAERGNHRVQIFSVDGLAITTIGRVGTPAWGETTWHWGDGNPLLMLPTRVRWRSPDLEIECAHGETVSLDLGLALRVAAIPAHLAVKCAAC